MENPATFQPPSSLARLEGGWKVHGRWLEGPRLTASYPPENGKEGRKKTCRKERDALSGTVAAFRPAAGLPDGGALFDGEVEGIAFPDAEGLVPGVDVRQGTVDAPFAEGMRVGLGEQANLLVADVARPDIGVGEEESLLRGEAVGIVAKGLGRHEFLEGGEGYLQAAMVGDVLAQGELAVGVEVGQHLDGVEVVDEDTSPLLEAGGVVSRPPVLEVAVLVVLAALVVEAVGHLVANDHADGAVVAGVVGRHVKEGVLEYAGGEAYLVGGGVVVGIDGLGRHEPLVAIDGLAGLGEHVVVLEGVGAGDVGPVRVVLHAEGGVVAPPLGVANLDAEGGEFLEGLGLGFLAHPGEAPDAVAESGLEVSDESFHAGLGLGREVAGDVHLAHGLAEDAINCADGTTPAGLEFLATGESATVKVEVLLDESVTEVAGGPVDDGPLEVVLHGVEVFLGHYFGAFAHGIDLADVDFSQAFQPEGLEVEVPVDARGLTLEVGDSHLVVVVVGVAKVDGAFGSPCQACLDGEDVLGRLLGLLLVPAGESEHAGDVLFVLRPDVAGVLVVVDVVFPLAEAEATLVGDGDVHGAVHLVGPDVDAEEGAVACAPHGGHEGGEFSTVGHGSHAVEVCPDGLDAVGVEAGTVHGHVVERADFLGHATLGLGLGGEFLDQAPDLFLVVLVEEVHRPETGVFTGQGV